VYKIFGETRELSDRDAAHLTIGSSDRGPRLRWAKEGVDDLDKSAWLVVGEAPRRSTSSLGARDTNAHIRTRRYCRMGAPPRGIST
jgi:hypothetical protein